MFTKTKTKKVTYIKEIKEKITIITLKQQSNHRDKIPIILGGAHKEKVKRNKKGASACSAGGEAETWPNQIIHSLVSVSNRPDPQIKSIVAFNNTELLSSLKPCTPYKRQSVRSQEAMLRKSLHNSTTFAKSIALLV